MLEPIVKGLIEWIYGLIEDMADYVFGDIIDVMTMDMDYFRRAAPVVDDISEIILALGWALLLGNLVFQLLKSIMSGAGFEGEDPRMLFMRTFAFSFLLLASPQICDMCSKMTGTVVAYLSIPRSFAFSAPTGMMFSAAGGVSWLIAIIVSIILIVQIVKLFFDIGERYVITCVLTFMAPLAFAMGGSKNTNDIFKGWCRMYGSMNLMLIMNLIFLKLITNAMANMWASNIIVWLVFVMALTRVARKIDAHIAKIGLNPAQTSNSVGVRFPGAMTLVVVRTLASLVGKSAGGMKGSSGGGNNSASHSHSSNGPTPPPNSGGASRSRNNPPSNNGVNTSPGDANVNVSVNNQSRVTKVNNNMGNTTNRQANNATNNSRYTSNNQTNNDSRNNSRSDNSNRDGSNSGNNQRGRNANGGAGIYVQNQTQAQAQSLGRVTAAKHTSRNANTNTTQRSESSRDTTSNRENAANTPRNTPVNPPLSRGTTPVKSSNNTAHQNVTVSQNAENKNSSGVSVKDKGQPARNISVPVVAPAQSMGRMSGTSRSADNRSVNNNAVGNSSVNADSEVHNSNVSSNDGRTDRRSTVNVGGNKSSSNVSGGNLGVNVNNATNVRGGNTVNTSTDNSGTTHYASNINTNTTERGVNPEYKFGRYDPAAANRKGRKNYYTKDTEPLKRKGEYKRGENDGGTAKKRRTESRKSGPSRRRSN